MWSLVLVCPILTTPLRWRGQAAASMDEFGGRGAWEEGALCGAEDDDDDIMKMVVMVMMMTMMMMMLMMMMMMMMG